MVYPLCLAALNTMPIWEKGKDHLIDLDSLAAIVTVSDDGGSSGRLVEEFDMLPPGDIRRLLFTLSDADELAGLFEHRFSSNGELGGHTVGNLLLTALTEKFEGNFPKAIQAASRLLSVRGQIIPVTLDYTVLCAELADGEIVRGESTIPVRENREPIKRVFFEPRENGKTHHSPDAIYECQAHEGLSRHCLTPMSLSSVLGAFTPALCRTSLSKALSKPFSGQTQLKSMSVTL